MRTAAFSLILLGLAAFSNDALAQTRPRVLVELFTAQGCSSCPKANQMIGEMADREGVLPLTFNVDYWDYLGWPDTFAKAEFAERQNAYLKPFELREVYTPQVVIDGRHQAPGSKPEQVGVLIDKALEARKNPPDMLFMHNGRIAVGSGPVPKGGAEVWLVRYDPRAQEVDVKRGDNRGETIAHHNVVRQLKRLGAWKGKPTAFRLPPAEEDNLETLVVVQGAKGGRVIAFLQKEG